MRVSEFSEPSHLPRLDLTPEQLQEAAWRALEIDRVNRAAGAVDRLSTDIDPKRDKINGFLGEVCFEVMTGMAADRTIKPREGGHDFAFTRRCGTKYTIDVKSTWRRGGRLLVQVHPKLVPCDFYALMVGVDTTGGWFAGVIDGPTIIREENIDHKLKRPAYAWPQSGLFPSLKDLLRR